MALVGAPAGLAVADLACGEGHYTRRLRRAGAARVLGVDRSPAMIELARAEEAARPLGVEYVVADCSGPIAAGPFDLVVAAYLLNYARDRAELAALCRGVARLLKPTGRFVAVDTNPDLDLGRTSVFRGYGFEVEAPGGAEDGAPIHWTFHLESGPVRIENYHLPAEARVEALREAGFGLVSRHAPQLAPGDGAGPVDWGPFLSNPPITFLDASVGSPDGRKPSAPAILGLNAGGDTV
jgi:SAM-dependent methyltransferase